MNKFYCVVLDIREKDNKTEQCILSFISLDDMRIPYNSEPGTYKIEVLNSSITVQNNTINLKSTNVLVNDQPISGVDTSNFVTNEDLTTQLETLKEEILTIANGGSNGTS